jgi:hypothetical protein
MFLVKPTGRGRVLFVVVVMWLVASACGGADETATTQADATTTTTTTADVTTTTVAAIAETTTTQLPAVEETTTTTEAPIVSEAQSATIAAYETAWNDGNEDALRALFAPGAILEDSTFGDLDTIDKIVASSVNRLAMEVALSIDGCAASGEAVTCEAEFDGAVPVAMNFVPWRDRYVFSFEDGQITNIKVTCIICWDGGADQRLTAWVKTVDPTAVAALSFGYNLVLTEEKAAAWLEWAPKWQEAGRP